MKSARLAWLVLALAGPAAAQAPSAPTGDVPPGPATLRGRVVVSESGAPAPQAEVVLYALPGRGAPGVRRTESDTEGRFALSGISADPSTAYLVGARWQGVPFPGDRVSFAAGETERQVEIRVSPLTQDATSLAVVETELRFEWVGDRLAVSEVHRLRNGGTRTIYVPEAARGPGRAAFRAELPEGAEDFRMPLGIEPEGLVRRGRELAFHGPLYPGEQELGFSYRLPASGARLAVEKRLPSGAGRLVVRVPEAGPQVESAALVADDPTVLQGRRYRQLSRSGLAPGSRVQLSFELPPVRIDRDAVSLAETRVFLEYDDAVLLVNEEHLLRVAGDAHVAAPPDGHLLRLPLPPEAEDLRFDTGSFDFGLLPSDDGGVELRGPLPPGDSQVQIVYRIPLSAATVRFERRFTRPLPLLSVYVVDTGLLARSERLHRRRPVRSGERTFLHLEAFQIEPDEPVTLSLAPLPPRPRLPRAAVLALVGLAAALAIGVLTAPLRRGAAGELDLDAEEDVARDEREAVYAAIRDLEHDHETGKLSEADYASLRRELRARAAALLRDERQDAVAPVPERTPARCPSCGSEPRPEDRFCARCGERLAVAPAREQRHGASG